MSAAPLATFRSKPAIPRRKASSTAAHVFGLSDSERRYASLRGVQPGLVATTLLRERGFAEPDGSVDLLRTMMLTLMSRSGMKLTLQALVSSPGTRRPALRVVIFATPTWRRRRSRILGAIGLRTPPSGRAGWVHNPD